MLSLKWGDVLSMLLPGAVVLFAAAPYFPVLNERIENIDKTSPAAGVALLMAAALAGGFLEAVTRITWEKYWLVWRCPAPKGVLRSSIFVNSVELYERGVQGSYKYATFYANFAWAIVLLLILRHWHRHAIYSVSSILLMGSVVILLRASHVQWTYYVKYVTEVFGPRSDDATERTAAGNAGEINE